jgi:chemotaxis protein methyltransferase CheR
MTAEEVALVVALCRARAGLKLAPDKTYLMESRLGPVARRESFDSVSDLLAAVRGRRDEALVWAVVEAVASGETAFFRDRTPFQAFREELIPQLARARGGHPIRVWSAACATGQEVYSLAMLAEEMAAEDPSLRIELAASDLSAKALERAQGGLYNQFEVQRGLPIRLLARYFENNDDQWRIAEAIRKRVRWRRINLVAGLTAIGRFDVVFCRHVLGHMTEEAQVKVLAELTQVIPEDGYLVLGQNEAVAGVGEAFRPVVGRPGLFRRNPDYRAAAA